jgi:hypothetical protein
MTSYTPPPPARGRVPLWRFALLASAGLYAVALLGAGLEGGRNDPAGYQCLMFGWLLFMNPFVLVAWAANFPYFALFPLAFTPAAKRIPPWLGFVPLAAALAVFGVNTMPRSIENGGVDEVHLGDGGAFWLASLALFAPVLWMRRREERTNGV